MKSKVIQILGNFALFLFILLVLIINFHFMPGLFNERSLDNVPLLNKLFKTQVQSKQGLMYSNNSAENTLSGVNVDMKVIHTEKENITENQDKTDVQLLQVVEEHKEITKTDSSIINGCDMICASTCGYKSENEISFQDCLKLCKCPNSKLYFKKHKF